MSYRHTDKITFKENELKVRVPLGAGSPERCPDHETCFKAPGRAPATRGFWRLIEPVKIDTFLPGTKQKLLWLRTKGLKEGGGYGTSTYAKIRVELDGGKLPAHGLLHKDTWFPNDITLDESVDAYNELDLRLEQYAFIFLPGASVIIHDAKITIKGEYWNDIPPETGYVEIPTTNRKTGDYVHGARVLLMDEQVIVAEDYTDGGSVIFENIKEGVYTIVVYAGGYHDFEGTVKVEAPGVLYPVEMTPVEKPPIPWWVWPAVGGVVLVGAVTVLPRLMGGRERPPMYVVK